MSSKLRAAIVVAVVVVLALAIVGGIVLLKERSLPPAVRLVELEAQAPGLSAPELQRGVTIPLEVALAMTPGIARTESVTVAGDALVRLFLDPKATEDAVRVAVLERVRLAHLPDATLPSLLPSHGPNVLRYVLEGRDVSALELADAQEWELQRELRQVPGVVDVLSCGARLTQVGVTVDAARARALGVSGQDVVRALQNAAPSGPRPVFTKLDDLTALQVGTRDGAPIFVRDVAVVARAPEPERCAAHRDGTDVVVAEVQLRRDADLAVATKGVERVLAAAEAKGRVRVGRIGFGGAPAHSLVRVRAPASVTETSILTALAAAGKRDVVTRRSRDADLELLVPLASADVARENAAIAAALATLPGVGWELPEAKTTGIVRARFRGADPDALATAADKAAALLRAEPSLHGVVASTDATSPDLAVQPDRAKLASFGLSASDVALAFGLAAGHDAGRFYDGERERTIVVRTIEGARPDALTPSPEAIASIMLPRADGTWVPLGAVARLEQTSGPRVLLRVDSVSAVDVLASPRDAAAAKLARAKLQAGLTLPPGVTLTFEGE